MAKKKYGNNAIAHLASDAFRQWSKIGSAISKSIDDMIDGEDNESRDAEEPGDSGYGKNPHALTLSNTFMELAETVKRTFEKTEEKDRQLTLYRDNEMDLRDKINNLIAMNATSQIRIKELEGELRLKEKELEQYAIDADRDSVQADAPEETKHEIAALRREAEKLSDMLSSRESAISAETTKYDAIIQEIKSGHASLLHEKEARIAQLAAEKDALENSAAEMRRALQQNENEIKSREIDIEKAKQILLDREARVAALTDDENNLKAVNESLRGSVRELEKKAQAREEEINKAIENVKLAADAVADGLRRENESLKQELSAAKAAPGPGPDDVADLNGALAHKDALIRELESRVEKAGQDMASLREELDLMNAQLSDYHDSNASMKNIIADNDRENESLKDRIYELEKKLCLYAEDIENKDALDERLQNAAAEIKSLKENNEKLNAELAEARKTKAYNPQLDSAIELCLKEAEVRTRQMMKEKEELENECQEIKESLEAAVSQKEAAIAQMGDNVKMTEARAAELAKEKEMAEARIKELEEELENTRAKALSYKEKTEEKFNDVQEYMQEMQDIIESYASREKALSRFGPLAVAYEAIRRKKAPGPQHPR